MEQTNEQLGKGNLFRLMLKYSVPCVLSLLVSALYNIVDQIFIGHSAAGDLGNAATGVVFPVFVIAQSFAWWFGDGCAAYLNICQGENKADGAHRVMGTGIIFSAAAGLAMIAALYPIKRPLLYFFGASDNSIELAVKYFDVILAFMPVFTAMNTVNAVIRADGSPAWSMASMLAGAITNIILDAVFILALDMGMAGAAWATVIGQSLSLAVGAFYLARKTKTFAFGLKSFVPDMRKFGNAVKLGLSSFATQLTIVALAVVCNAMLKKYGGASAYGEDIPLAVIAIENKVFTVVINLTVGIILGCQPIVGYNIGAKNYARVKKLFAYILICTATIGTIATLLFELAPMAVVGIFGAPKYSDPVLYKEFAVKTFRIFLMFVTFTCTVKMTSIFFMAAGKPVRAVIASVIRDVACFIPLAVALPVRMGIDGVLWAAPIADGISIAIAVVMAITYFVKIRNDERRDATANETLEQ